MRKLILVTACFLIFQNGVAAGASELRDSGVKRNDLPHAFLSKMEGSVAIRKEGGSITVQAHKSTLEEVVQKIAEEEKVILRFYCDDPGLKQERAVSLRISGESIVKVLRPLLSEDHRFTMTREGEPTENGRDADTVNVYPKECSGKDHPVRVFIAPKGGHPLLSKPLEEISVEELGDVLKREGPGSRRRAAEALGIKGDERGIPYAKEALKDENMRVMLGAVNALNKLGQKYGSEKVVDAIYERFLERPYPELLFVMAQLDRERIWPILDGLTDQTGEKERAIIVRAVLLTKDRRGVKYLSKIASTGSMENSGQAIYAIGKLGGSEAGTTLMGLLRGGDVQRQARAAQAVHFLPEGEGVVDVRAEVEKIVRQETVSDVFLNALAKASYLEPLKKLISDPDSKPELKIRALGAMVSAGAEKTIEVMSMGLNDKAPQVRLASVESLGAVAVEAAIPYLLKATEHEDAKVRRSAVKGLSLFPYDEQVVEALGKAIDDTEEEVRRQAVDSLGALGRPSEAMTAILRSCKNHKDPYVANKAGAILSNWSLK